MGRGRAALTLKPRTRGLPDQAPRGEAAGPHLALWQPRGSCTTDDGAGQGRRLNMRQGGALAATLQLGRGAWAGALLFL